MADRVAFTRPDAERIARAVRRVEAMRDAAPLTFRRVPDEGRREGGIRLASFDGSWTRGVTKIVTLTGSGNTAAVRNSLLSLPDRGNRACIVGRDGQQWELVNWQQDLVYPVDTVSLTANSLDFGTVPVAGFDVTHSTFSISVVSCTTS